MSTRIKNLALDILDVFRDRIFIYLFLASVIILGLIWYFWMWRIYPSGFQIYTQFYLTENRDLASLMPPVFASIIFLINFMLGIIARKREALASYLLVGSNIFILGLVLVLLRHYLSLI